ncbi:hypothetical protein SJS82_17885 [Aeromonas media]|uniref:Uncharacterized protein n=1 Tax=Aeromonas media TaxID=651 RepID=A0AAP6L3H8_AERME|nr:hypothetical protein [Aeromonas media]MDX7923802.1 hypothetical protein [Aeromonas media]
MAGTSLLALPGDIASVPGDVALMTKAVTRKRAVLPGEMFPTDIRNT